MNKRLIHNALLVLIIAVLCFLTQTLWPLWGILLWEGS